MIFLDHVQNLHIHAEKTHKDFGAHCMKYVNFVHDPEKQYRSTVPAVRPLSIGLQVTEIVGIPNRACGVPLYDPLGRHKMALFRAVPNDNERNMQVPVVLYVYM